MFSKIKAYLEYEIFRLTHNMWYETLVFDYGRKRLSEIINDPNDHTLTIEDKKGIVKYAKRKYGIDMKHIEN